MFQEQKELLLYKGTVQLEKERPRWHFILLFAASVLLNLSVAVFMFAVEHLPEEAATVAVKLEERFTTSLLAIPFVCGFVLTYSIKKLLFLTHVETGSFLDGYQIDLSRDNQRKTIMLCAAVGGLDAILFFFMFSWR
jgi:hypothetical protein